MPTYTVRCAHRETGEEATLTIDAPTKTAATSKANTMGFVVADVESAGLATAPPPQTIEFYAPAPPPPRRSIGIAICPLCNAPLTSIWTGPTSGSSAIGSALVLSGVCIAAVLGVGVGSCFGAIPGLAMIIWGFIVGLRGRKRMACTMCHYRSNH